MEDKDKSNVQSDYRVYVDEILEDIKEIGFVHLTEEDVVRHPVVRKIISAYGEEDKRVRSEGN